jgi:serine/threonine protein kinase
MASQAHGFTMRSAIRADAEAVLYRGQRASDGHPVLLKTPSGGRPSAAQVARLCHEYSVLRSIDGPGVARAIGIENFGDSLALVLEYVGDQSLQDLVGRPLLDQPTFLCLAAAMAESVEVVHRHHVIHKDIRPHNFFRDSITDEVTLIEFGAATRLALEDRRVTRTERLEGTPAYMSPAQTGRMNRSLDRRTDLYSLGVSLYELLTGVLPFRSDDPLELVHSHIARSPVPPHVVRIDCPRVLSEIILRLLAKNAEDRYQDVAGLKADLVRCQRMLAETGAVGSNARWDPRPRISPAAATSPPLPFAAGFSTP